MKQQLINLLNSHTVNYSHNNISIGDAIPDTKIDEIADEILRLFNIPERKYCECGNPKGEGNQSNCANCGDTFKTF